MKEDTVKVTFLKDWQLIHIVDDRHRSIQLEAGIYSMQIIQNPNQGLSGYWLVLKDNPDGLDGIIGVSLYSLKAWTESTHAFLAPLVIIQ